MEQIEIEYLGDQDSTDEFEQNIIGIRQSTRNQKRKSTSEIKTLESKRTKTVDKNANNTSISGTYHMANCRLIFVRL